MGRCSKISVIILLLKVPPTTGPGVHWQPTCLSWRKWQSTPVLLPGKFHGQRSLLGSSLWGCKEWTRPSPGRTPASVVVFDMFNMTWPVFPLCVLVFGMEELSFATVCLLFIPMWTSEIFQWTLISYYYLTNVFMRKLSPVWSVSPALGWFLCLCNTFPPLDHS